MSWTTSSSFSKRCHNNSLSFFMFPLIYSKKNYIGIDSNQPVAYVHVLFVFQMEILMNFWTVIKAYDMFDMKISIGHISWNLRYTIAHKMQTNKSNAVHSTRHSVRLFVWCLKNSIHAEMVAGNDCFNKNQFDWNSSYWIRSVMKRKPFACIDYGHNKVSGFVEKNTSFLKLKISA